MIKVYILDVVDLFSEEVQKEYLALLPDYGVWKKKITSINDYVFIKDKALSIGAALLLYFLLENGISPSELRISQNWKLYVKQNVFFNISHTDRFQFVDERQTGAKTVPRNQVTKKTRSKSNDFMRF